MAAPGSISEWAAQEFVEIEALAKAGTVHVDHDGATFIGPEYVLRCSCGEALVDPSTVKQVLATDAEREDQVRYRATHSADGYALGSPEYPDNRQGRRALARTWKRADR